MSGIKFEYKNWSGEVKQYFRPDLIAGLTLWAMIVPEAVAYADLAGAPNAAAGLYGIIIVLPIYALFASSRFLVATSTSAISVTTAGFLGTMASEPEAAFAAVVICAAIVFLLFYYFKLGFIADFISEPVSRGFMFGLALFIIVGQAPKLFQVEKTEGNTFQQIFGLIENIPNSNWVAVAFAVVIFAILIGSGKISKKIPGGLIAIAVTIVFCYFTGAEDRWGLEMVGALPEGLPKVTLPTIEFSDLAIAIPASIGLVIIATSEATVLAESLALKHNQKLNVDQQFFAFGISNLVGGFFGALLGGGSTSSTMVDHEAGAKTLMSTIWAAVATLLTIFFLTGLFVYLPEVFLGVLIIHAVYHMLKIRGILSVKHYSKGEYYLALIAILGVLLFDVLDGLLIAMLLNVGYFIFKTSKVKMGLFGYADDTTRTMLPLSVEGKVVKPADDVLALGLEDGLMFYASARSALTQATNFIEKNPDAKKIVVSLGRVSEFDYSSTETLLELQNIVKERKLKLYLTDIHSTKAWAELHAVDFDPDIVDISTHLDLSKI